jgi:hypothetical protein
MKLKTGAGGYASNPFFLLLPYPYEIIDQSSETDYKPAIEHSVKSIKASPDQCPFEIQAKENGNNRPYNNGCYHPKDLGNKSS